MVKRSFDVIFSAASLVILIPVFLVLYPFVRLDSPGPFFFRQARMGRYGKPFNIFKIRTMRVNSAREGADSQNKEDSRRSITTRNDPRITRIGSFLRKSKIDELPQVINVLLGHMSFVGPRPELLQYHSVHPEQWEKILSVRPGITDSASLEFFNEEKDLPDDETADAVYCREILPRKQKMYLEYVRNRSFINDLKIIFRTAKHITKIWVF